jgi:hypothetical protein
VTQLTLALRILAFGALVLAYQNCTPVKFNTSNAAVGAEVAGSADNPNATPEPGATPKAGATPDQAENETEDDKDCKDEEDAKLEAAISNTTEANCRSALEKIASATAVAANGSIGGASGRLFFSGTQIASVNKLNGQITISSLDPMAKIASLSDSTGDIYICNMDVAKIDKVSQGHIIVIGGDVGDVSDFSGELEVIGGKVTGKVSNSTGVIKVK